MKQYFPSLERHSIMKMFYFVQQQTWASNYTCKKFVIHSQRMHGNIGNIGV